MYPSRSFLLLLLLLFHLRFYFSHAKNITHILHFCTYEKHIRVRLVASRLLMCKYTKGLCTSSEKNIPRAFLISFSLCLSLSLTLSLYVGSCSSQTFHLKKPEAGRHILAVVTDAVSLYFLHIHTREYAHTL